MRKAAATLAILTGVLVAPGAASAGDSVGATAPAYPGNTLRIDAPDRLVSGSVVASVKLAGTAVWNEPSTSATTTRYGLSLYVQDPTVQPSCATSYGEQLARSINLPLNASTSISGFVMHDGLSISPAVPSNTVTYPATPTTPFIIRPGVRRVLLCAYQRYITDDVAVAAKSADVDPARCRLRSSSVRRGTAFRVSCNVSGRLTVRLRRGSSTRTLRATIGSSGNRSLSSRRVAEGSYRASFSVKGQSLGSQRVRVR